LLTPAAIGKVRRIMSLLDRRFLFVVGKGGVGKTMASAAIAVAAAKRGKRVLVAMCNSKDRLSHLLEVPPIGPKIVRVLPNMDAVNMEPGAALEEYGLMVLKVRALYKVIFENRFVSAFLRGTPGLEAWAMLGKAQHHALETDRSGRPRYDLIVLDAPATGHGLDLLRVPKVIIDVAPPGLLRREAEKAWQLFSDPRRTGVCLVSLPEEMPTSETLELHDKVTKELGLPVAALVLNRVLPKLFNTDELSALDALDPAAFVGSELEGLINAARGRAIRQATQAESIVRLDALKLPTIELPNLLALDLRRAEVEKLAALIV
jgi:anion-transporting  ArsA/GET3 family ATPase